MKRLFLFSLAVALFSGILNAQDTTETIVNLDAFTKIEIEDDFIVTLIQSDSRHAISENPNIRIENDNGDLEISGTSEYKNRKDKKTHEQLTIYFSSLESLDLSGSVSIKMPENLQLSGQHLDLEMSGASSVKLNLNYDLLNADLSGASQLILSGTARRFEAECSGASHINASNLQADAAEVESSGASSIKMNTKQVTGTASGASNLQLNPDAESSVSRSGAASVTRTKIDTNGYQYTYNVTTTFNDQEFEEDWNELAQEMAELARELADEWAVLEEELSQELSKLGEEISAGMDETQVTINEAQVTIKKEQKEREIEKARQQAEKARQQAKEAREQADKARQQAMEQVKEAKKQNPNVDVHTIVVKKNKKPSFIFDPAYSVVDFGFNGYGQDPFQNSLPAGYEGMELSQNTSLVFNLNVLDYGFRIAGRGRNTFGLGVGLGVGWNIYKFYDKSTVPITAINPTTQVEEFMAAPYVGAEPRENFQKSKLQISSLKVPVFLIFQKKKGFHVSAGVVGNVRIGSSAKQVYDLVDGGKKRTKGKNDFYLSPFRADAEVRIGYRNFSAFATYALTDMFLSNRGPELSQYSFGISLGV
ncbi:MAG: DUF2807 domain-containing protein [Bacteroidales bacterium]|jgi:hypothetical protein|nr:DUF2807 domain-containing protein [Bacteroidales bacterium]